jgi:lipopolysaccharide heptosyltransferase II
MISPDRPALTTMCERALPRVLRHSRADNAQPLSTVPRRILAVKVHGLGDSVMVRSILEHFRRRHPGVEIGILAGPANRDVLTTGSEYQLHQYDQRTLGVSTILRTLRDIRKRRYEAAIDFEQGSLAGAAFIRATGIPVRAGFLPLNDSAKATLLTHPIRFHEEDSMWTSFKRLMRIIDRDLPEDISTMPLPLDDHTRRSTLEWMRAKTCRVSRQSIAFHLGCAPSRSYRRWPVERFVALAEQLRVERANLFIVLTGQPSERPLIEQFSSSYSGPVVDATGLGSIGKTAALLSECELLVSNDTGIMHLGAAMGVPTVGIFGSASPRRWAPVGPHATAVSASGIECSPCAETYLLRDPVDCANPDRMRCLREVSVEMVLKAVRRVTSERRTGMSSEFARALNHAAR